MSFTPFTLSLRAADDAFLVSVLIGGFELRFQRELSGQRSSYQAVMSSVRGLRQAIDPEGVIGADLEHCHARLIASLRVEVQSGRESDAGAPEPMDDEFLERAVALTKLAISLHPDFRTPFPSPFSHMTGSSNPRDLPC